MLNREYFKNRGQAQLIKAKVDSEEFGVNISDQRVANRANREVPIDQDKRRDRLSNLDPEERIAQIKAMKELEKQRELERKHEEV